MNVFFNPRYSSGRFSNTNGFPRGSSTPFYRDTQFFPNRSVHPAFIWDEIEPDITPIVEPQTFDFNGKKGGLNETSQEENFRQHHIGGSMHDEFTVGRQVTIPIVRPRLQPRARWPFKDTKSVTTKLKCEEGPISGTIAFELPFGIVSQDVVQNLRCAERVPVELNARCGSIDIIVTYPEDPKTTRKHMSLIATADSGSIEVTLPQEFCSNGTLIAEATNGCITIDTVAGKLPRVLELQASSNTIKAGGSTMSSFSGRCLRGGDGGRVQGDKVHLKAPGGSILVSFTKQDEL